MQTVPQSGPSRVLVMVEQPLIAEVIKLTLNHGVYVTCEAKLPLRPPPCLAKAA